MALVYQTIRAALLPISPRDLPRVLDAYLQHLARPNQKSRPKQIELFLQK
ncbi:MAG: hypothetical protein RL033_4613, partial [Pseudomonadota bacterium]